MAMSGKHKFVVGILLLLAALAIPAYVVFTFFPQVILDIVRAQYAREAAVTEKSAVVDGYTIPYYEGGSGETLVLIHGFGDSMISFVQSARWLTPKYRVIMPEVPGFGETQRDPALDYGPRAQAERLHTFFHQIGLKNFHLGGNSMGGHISAAYALLYPEDVESLLLIDAAGITISDSEPYQDAEKPVATIEDFDAYMDKLFVKKPHIPGAFKRYFVQQGQGNFEWQNRIRADIRKSPDAILNGRIGNVKVPTLVLWGDKDQLISLAVGEAYHKAIPGSEFVVFKDCGHSPQYERPQETAEAIVAFLSK
ncbi:MAG TPA: alpha/beta hydrolase [Candidatus Hydrogenedentes bacterium]|nr:alpha/beta hydrolase [Candidatus Hydrogenedentota bacterium]